ncbi:hypothetical protein QBC42DRAFT_1791 [Cladorrhinum samala]|uniref:Uncharacterized protein n=1 Tax=Cladorrhinum samala TaxID=585594 RepID=A0AAV9I2D4_9PEZI|nr:hypothetical protein QBC42DRAFT_1791 [Cladorrhinum samala]
MREKKYLQLVLLFAFIIYPIQPGEKKTLWLFDLGDVRSDFLICGITFGRLLKKDRRNKDVLKWAKKRNRA